MARSENRNWAIDSIRQKTAGLTRKYTADHLADIADTTPKEIYKYGSMNGVQDMPSSVLMLLSRGLIEVNKDFGLGNLLIPSDCQIIKQNIGKATGEMDSKILRITKSFGGLIQTMQTGNPTPGLLSIAEIESALADIFAEMALIESRFEKEG